MKNLTLPCLLTALAVLTGLQLNAQCDSDCIGLSTAVDDYTVQCFEDLEAVSCDASITAWTDCNEEMLPIACVTAEQRVATTTCDATTAYGVGPDGALRIYGINLAGLASEYFHPTGDGLTMVQYENDVAILTGQVACDADATQIFNVHITFENRVDGSDWTGGFKHTAACTPDTDLWDIYTMKNDQSYMTGAGSIAGSYLTLTHAPASEFFGFQIGEGASNHNCDFGAGGWFAWEGQIDGAYAAGAMGDVIVDLDCSEQSTDRCDAAVDVVYNVLDTTCGVLHTFTQTVSRLDDTAPTFDNIPADVTIDCADALPEVPEVTATDNCDDPDSPTVTYIGQFTTAYTAMSCRTLERRWSATDLCGNITLDAQVLTIVDTEDPTLTLTIPADITLDVDGDCNVDASTSGAAGDATYTATDNCIMDAGSPVLTHSDAIVDSTSTGCYGIDRTFTLTAQDSCGNSSMESATQRITIQDIEAPVITLNAMETTMSCDDWACDLATLEAAGYVSFSDNCELDGAEITNCIDGSGGCVTPVPTYEVHYQVVDMCGNVTNATQYIELTDDVDPEVSIDCPAQATAYLDANCETDISLAETGEATGSATDNCDDAPEVEVTYEDGDPIYICAGDDDLQLEGSHTILRTFTATATDHCDNTSSTTCTQLITVLDTVSAEMTLITCPADVTLYLDADCYADTSTDANDYATATAEDNCDAQPSIDITHADATAADCDGGGSYTLTRTFSAEATDDCGNTGASISCDQTITVLDTISPIFDAYDIYVHVSCELIADPTDPTQVPITAQDNCDEDVSYTIEAEFLSGGCPGTWMRTWTAHDNCGNTTTTEQYVEMFDLILPTVTCPEDATVYLTADCTAATSTDDLGLADLSDNCTSSDELYDALVVTDSEQTLTCGDDGTPEGSYTFTRNFATIDYCENENDCTYLITVLDTISPAAAITDEIVACHDYDADTEFTTITSSDNCDTDIAYTWEQTDLFDQECIGTYKVERTYTFVDDCGNTTVRTQIIQVEDTEAPVAVGDTETTIACHDYSDDDSDEANLLISLSDNCGTITWSFTDIIFSGGCVQPAGMYQRTYTFSDDCGNTDTFTQYITLVDEVDPTWNEDLPADATEECDNVTPAAVLTASDNCDDDVDITFTETTEGDDDDCPQEYTITRTWEAEDDCGNSISHTQTVTVEDTTSPEFDMPLSIRSNELYVASTGFDLGDNEASYQGIEGFVIAATFQLNLEYQPGVDSDAVDVFNNYGEGTVHNWTDPEYYVMTISEAGGLPAWNYSEDEADEMDADLQWTITGWGQTILGGTIEPGRLVVTTDYRPFDADAYVNDIEVFEGNILQEVIAYTFDGAAADIGSGTQLGVELLEDGANVLTASD
ncbi:MAG: hypothetical protein P8M07_09240, partial [Flavobacteriales bacterium]|nr:hypothetical protein [Flavobacteriales bacterium]